MAPEAGRYAVGGGCQSGWGGYCRLQMPWKPALAVRGTVSGHMLGALEGGGGAPPLLMHPRPTPPPSRHTPLGMSCWPDVQGHGGIIDDARPPQTARPPRQGPRGHLPTTRRQLRSVFHKWGHRLGPVCSGNPGPRLWGWRAGRRRGLRLQGRQRQARLDRHLEHGVAVLCCTAFHQSITGRRRRMWTQRRWNANRTDLLWPWVCKVER